MPNANLTQIAFILDRSGSMEAMREQAISGFNHFLEAQKQLPGEARMDFVLFNNSVVELSRNIPLSEMVPLNPESFEPDGGTALNDAMGLTITRLGKRLAKLPEAQRPGKVIVAVLTDGEENSSMRYTTYQIAQLIEHQRSKYAWEFLFIGSGIHVEEQIQSMGIQQEDSIAFETTAEGMDMAMMSLNEAVASRRSR